MKEKCPKAYVLAKYLEERETTVEWEGTDRKGKMIDSLAWSAAEELRRLHQSEREAWRYASELEQEIKRLSQFETAYKE